VVSAQEMYQASMGQVVECDIFMAAAAVADFRPVTIADKKMKKTGRDTMTIDMRKNPDIVAAVAALENKPFVLGFAAETHDVIAYARDKMQRKKLNMIVANDVSDEAIGFNTDHNKVTILTAEKEYPLLEASKFQLAQTIVQMVAEQLMVNK